MKVLAFTDCGLKYDHNEDSYLVNNCAFNDKHAVRVCSDENMFSVAVFDGVGGANAGEIASMTAAQEISNRLTSSSTEEDIKDALLQANGAILKLADEQKDLQGMACTVAGILICNDSIITYNVGDSRIYKIKVGMMMQLTTDDSYENYLIKEYGAMAAISSSFSHTITSCLGKRDLKKDDVHINVVSAIKSGERYFICSDGVTDYINIDDLDDILTGELSFEEMSKEISRHVYENGAKDNFTFIILEE